MSSSVERSSVRNGCASVCPMVSALRAPISLRLLPAGRCSSCGTSKERFALSTTCAATEPDRSLMTGRAHAGRSSAAITAGRTRSTDRCVLLVTRASTQPRSKASTCSPYGWPSGGECCSSASTRTRCRFDVWLGGLAGECEPFPIETWSRPDSAVHHMSCNWKTYGDNYLEGYHVPLVHPALSRAIDPNSYQVDVHDDGCDIGPRTREGAAATGAWLWHWPNIGLNLYEYGMSVERWYPTGPTSCVLVLDYCFDATKDAAARNDLARRGVSPPLRRGQGDLRGGPAEPVGRRLRHGPAVPTPRGRGRRLPPASALRTEARSRRNSRDRVRLLRRD